MESKHHRPIVDSCEGTRNSTPCAALRWPQAQALVGFGHEAPDWSLHWKQPGLSAPAILAAIVLGMVFVAVPFFEEAWRCWKIRTDGTTTRQVNSPGMSLP